MQYADDTLTSTHDVTLDSLSQQTSDGAARAQALQALQHEEAAVTSVIEYRSSGHLVIIGPAVQSVPLAEQLLDKMAAIAVIDPTPGAARPKLDDRITCITAEVEQVEGHLGDFQIWLQDRGTQHVALKSLLPRSWMQIDMVLDLSAVPCFDAQISPPGYFAPRGDTQKLAAFVDTIPELVGEFEKPRYFRYNPDICVHGRNHKTACTRCIDACPTLAIRSIGEQVQVDPYLCQGGGSCAAVCPSGAMQYIYPGLANSLSRIRRLLKDYHQAQGHDARVVLFEVAHSHDVYARLASLEENLLPLAVDELGAVDLAVMLNTFVYGAQQIIVLTSQDTPGRIHKTLTEQQALAHAFLQGLGYTTDRLVVTTLARLAAVPVVNETVLSPGSYASFDDKRTMIRLALEHLYQHAPLQPVALPLSAQAPFGEIGVNAQTCTLCLACTGACPTGALLTGSESPQLKFIEDNCVQCGLCELTCPEQAITRTQRYLFDSETRRSRRVLHEEPAFHCVSCGKPFATRRIIEQMQAKLTGHWMFGNERAMRRLQMCEDCRINDLWEEQGK